MTKINSSWQRVGTSSYILNGRGHVHLCNVPHTQMSVLQSWKNAQAQELAYTQLHLTQDSLVCRVCGDDIRKLLANHTNTPRWEKGRKRYPYMH